MIGIVTVMHKSKGCSRNTFEPINNFIKSLYKFCKKEFILYLFDNGSDEKYNVPNYKNIKYTYIKNQFERGLLVFNDGTNEAIKDGCDIIIVANDDIVFNKTFNVFLDIIENHENKDVGLYGSLSNGLLNNSSLQKANKPGEGILEITNLEMPQRILNGFMMAFTKEFYHRFILPDGNLWDTRNPWRGGEKILIERIRPSGGRMFIIKYCWIYHHKFRGWKQLIRQGKIK